MLLHLVKKDLLIAKKFVLISMLLIIAIPVLVMFLPPAIPAVIPFIYMVFFGEILLLQAIAQEEEKYPKAIALLCASPYQRNSFVLAKYTLYLLIFSYCSLIYTLITYFVGNAAFVNLTSFFAILLLGSVFFGIYMPLEFKYGYTKAKFAITAVIFFLSLGPPLFSQFFGHLNVNFSGLKALPPTALNLFLAFSNLAVFGTSLLVSIRIFAKKDL